jgi:hypothetical protein
MQVDAADDYPRRDAVEYTVRGGLPNVFAKLQAGEAVRIGYLGGSITAQGGWRPKTLNWFREQFPDAEVSEINAAIGGTGSDLGVYRLGHDVLRHEPDLLFVEFAVNDGGASPERIIKAMEGIVRQTWRHDPVTDICFVYTFAHDHMLRDLQEGRFPRAASVMEDIADHYGIPSIHMGLVAARMEAEGRLIFRGQRPRTDEERAALEGRVLFSGDGVHPYPEGGHDLYLAAVVKAMAGIRAAGDEGPHALPEPMDKENWEQATMVPLSAATLSDEWERLPTDEGLGRRFGRRMPELWRANQPGASITFRFRGTAVQIYDLLGPDCGQVIVTLDDREPVVRPRFDAYCTYHRLSKLSVASGLPDEIHTVRLEIHPEQIDKLAMLHRRAQNRNITELEPAKYDDTAWYAGAILIIGELVP